MNRAYDAVVVGGGPAGLAAATWLARYRRATIVVDAGEPRNRWVDVSHGYLARDLVPPGELLERARAELARYPGVEHCAGRATAVTREGDGFVVTVGADRLPARRLLLATGVVDQVPDVEGFFEHYGCQVFHCPTCEGYEARGREVVVLGWSAHLVGFALDLLNWAARVTVVTDGHRFEGDDAQRETLVGAGIGVVEDEAVALEGRRGDLRGVRLREGRVDCSMAFFSIGHRPVAELADQLGCRRDDQGYLQVDDCGLTSVTGVYAAGDVTPGLQLVQVAAGKGAVAGVGCALSLTRLGRSD